MPQLQFEAIGTSWSISTKEELSHQLKSKITGRIEEFDHCYSRFRADSLVTLWAKKAGEYDLPNDAERLFSFYKQLYDATNSLVTPLIGKILEQAGYDANYSLKPKNLTSPPTWEEVIEVKFSRLILKEPALLDFGAAGKGYLVDIIAHLLYTNEIDQFCVNAGGDMFARGSQYTIGLEDPSDETRILGTIKINNEALCSSAGNRRNWGKFHHIISPKTLLSVENVKATWVKADSAMLADGLATALFFVHPEILLRTFQFEYAMIEGDDMKISQNFSAELFRKD